MSTDYLYLNAKKAALRKISPTRSPKRSPSPKRSSPKRSKSTKRTKRTKVSKSPRKLNAYQQFMKENISKMSGSTAKERLTQAAKLWSKRR